MPTPPPLGPGVSSPVPPATGRGTWDAAPVPGHAAVRAPADPLLCEVWGGQPARLDNDVRGPGPIGALERKVKEQR